jgi:hypothetical protein
MRERDREFADASRIVYESSVFRAVARASQAISESADRSMTRDLLRRLRVTQIGVVIASACVTHALLVLRMPDALAPVKPFGYGVVLAFAAFVVAAGRITMRSSATATADKSAGTAKATKSS